MIDISPRMERVYLILGFCRPLASTGSANGHYKYKSVVSSASVGLVELVCDDSRKSADNA